MKKQINSIIKIMNTIEYGFCDEKGLNIIKVDPQHWDKNFYEFYYLLTPQELLDKKCGVCWDQVELERKLFEDNNIEVKTFFIYTSDVDMLPSHTFLTFQDGNKYYWFEHSWGIYKGVHKYDSQNELLLDVKEKFIHSNDNVINKEDTYIYQYQKPKKHILCEDFYEYIYNQKLIKLK